MEVAFDPAALLVAGRDDPRARGLDLLELAAQLRTQPRDLDGQAGLLHHLPQHAGRLVGRCVVEHDRERRAGALDRGALATVSRDILDPVPARVDVEPALGQPEADFEPGIAEHVRQHPLDRLRRDTAGPQLLEELRDAAPALVARAAEATIDGVLNEAAQRPERDRHRQRRARCRPGGPAPERRPEHQRRRPVRPGQQQRQRAVDEACR